MKCKHNYYAASGSCIQCKGVGLPPLMAKALAFVPQQHAMGFWKKMLISQLIRPSQLHHAGVDRCLSGWGMRGHCLLHLLMESVLSFGRMDEDGFAPYLRTRCPWRLAATVGQASGVPACLIPWTLYLCGKSIHSQNADGETATFGCLMLNTCNLLMFHFFFTPVVLWLLATCCAQLVWMPQQGVLLRQWLQNLYIIVQQWQSNCCHTLLLLQAWNLEKSNFDLQ